MVPELEQQLTALAPQIDWPPTPDIALRIASRLSAHNEMRSTTRWGSFAGSRWAFAAVAVIIALTALVAYPPLRDGIASWINVHVFFQRVHELPTLSPRPPGPLGQQLGLGSQTTLADARSKVAWPVLVPSQLGEPDEVYAQLPPEGAANGEVTLIYSTRPGIPVASETGVAVLITEARGAVNKDFFMKMLGPGTTIEEVTVAGHRGYWIAGSPHDFFFADANGNFRQETLRLATNTLLLDWGGTVVRIEGKLTKAQALQIAASLS